MHTSIARAPQSLPVWYMRLLCSNEAGYVMLVSSYNNTAPVSTVLIRDWPSRKHSMIGPRRRSSASLLEGGGGVGGGRAGVNEGTMRCCVILQCLLRKKWEGWWWLEKGCWANKMVNRATDPMGDREHIYTMGLNWFKTDCGNMAMLWDRAQLGDQFWCQQLRVEGVGGGGTVADNMVEIG